MEKELDKKKVARRVEIILYEDNTMNVNAPTDFGISMWILNEAQRAIIQAQLRKQTPENRIIRPQFKGITIGGN